MNRENQQHDRKSRMTDETQTIEEALAKEVAEWIPKKYLWGCKTKEEELRFFQEHKGNE